MLSTPSTASPWPPRVRASAIVPQPLTPCLPASRLTPPPRLPTPKTPRPGEPLMFRLDLGSTGRYCDGLSRRSFLQLGVAGMAGLGLPQLLRAKAASGSARNTSVILIWLDG